MDMIVLAWVLVFSTLTGYEVVQPGVYPTEGACMEGYVEATLVMENWSLERIANRPHGARCVPIYSAFQKVE